MFKVYLDGTSSSNLFYSSTSNTENLQILSPKLELAENSAGTFSFIVPPTNRKYGQFQKLVSRIIIKKLDNSAIYWEGRIIDEKEDFWKCRTYTCEGALAFLNDTVHPYHKYAGTPSDPGITVETFLGYILSNHNGKVASDKKINLGVVNISDTTKVVRYTNFETNFELVKKLVETYGGHVSIRHENNKRYLDWSETYSSTTSQTIQFGVNLLDYSSTMTVNDFCTVLIPQGVKLPAEDGQDFDEYLDVSSVNDGSIYVSLTAADYDNPPEVLPLAAFGYLSRVKRWEDITQASNLLTRAKQYLKDQQFDNLQLEIQAFDMRYASTDYQQINLLDAVHVISQPHGLDKIFPVKKMSIPLDSPENTAFTIGGDGKDSSFTSVARYSTDLVYDAIDDKPSEAAITAQYRREITDTINQHLVGYVNIISNDSGSQELVISDNPDYTLASNVWRWNMGGLAFSSHGYEPPSGYGYDIALTYDGRINASLISTGVLNADLITAGVLQDQVGGNHFRLNLLTGDLYINDLNIVAEDEEEIRGRNLIINTKAPTVSDQSKWPKLYEQLDNTRTNNWTVTKATYGHGIRMTKGSSGGAAIMSMGRTSAGHSLSSMNGLIAGRKYAFSSKFTYHLLATSVSKAYVRWRLLTWTSNTAGADYTSLLLCKEEITRNETKSFNMKFSFTVPYDAVVASLYFDIVNEGEVAFNAADFASTDYYEFAKMKLERGSEPTGWTAAPEDIPGSDEIVAKINVSPEEIQIQADKISLEGKNINLSAGNGITISSTNFSVTSAGVVTASAMNITGGSLHIVDADPNTDYVYLEDSAQNGGYAKLSPNRLTLYSKLQSSYTATPTLDYTGLHVNTTLDQIELVNHSYQSGGSTVYRQGLYMHGTAGDSSVTASGVSISTSSAVNSQLTASSLSFSNGKILVDGSNFAFSITNATFLSDGEVYYMPSSNVKRFSLTQSGLTFKNSSGTTTAEYPSGGLSVSSLNNNESSSVSTTSTAKDFVLENGTYLVTLGRYINTDNTHDAIWLVMANSPNGQTSRSHITPILVGSAAPSPTLEIKLDTDNTYKNVFKITTNTTYQRITITKLN